jgi:hypothetical protein
VPARSVLPTRRSSTCFLGSVFFSRVGREVDTGLDRRLRLLGSWGLRPFLYIMALVLSIPGSMLALLACLAYGLWDLPLALSTATTGASLSFLVAPYLVHAEKLL